MDEIQADRSSAVLVIDVGGTHVKVLATGQKEPRKIDSGTFMTAARMIREVKKATKDWNYGRVSIGYPGPLVHGRPIHDPFNLGPGWVGFDFRKAFGRPVKLINDAAMQALGSYRGGRMLFLGLGTGLGSAMIVNGLIEPMEIAHLPYKKGKTYEDYLGRCGLERLGKKKWRKHAFAVVSMLKVALEADDIVVGGGNAKKLKDLPPGVRLGDNENAFLGGFRMWEQERQRKETE
ncbi:MAG TPA: ROK family protein [Elusimicrobiota bacterium]|nr:ROK family protein [Elusimicrobiota bacterium]